MPDSFQAVNQDYVFIHKNNNLKLYTMKVGLIGFGKAGKAAASVILQNKEFSLEWVLRQSKVLESRSVSDNVFPNPLSDKLLIKLGNEDKGSYILTSISGKIIKEDELSNNRTELSFPDLKRGIYLLKVVTEKNMQFFRLVKL